MPCPASAYTILYPNGHVASRMIYNFGVEDRVDFHGFGHRLRSANGRHGFDPPSDCCTEDINQYRQLHRNILGVMSDAVDAVYRASNETDPLRNPLTPPPSRATLLVIWASSCLSFASPSERHRLYSTPCIRKISINSNIVTVT